jgi:hypothetical protein
MNKSETITELSKALVKFQSKLITVKKESTNPFFKNRYASLSAIIETVQAPLAECGLAIIQQPCGTNQLETILLHESGEFIGEVYEMKPTKPGPQELGSVITYQRRYALGAILSLNIDEDDDGNKASEPAKKEIKVMPDERFANMMEQVRASKTSTIAGNLIGLARRSFIFDTEQENILSEWENSLKQ